MAGVRRIIKKKVIASSIIEVIVAMVTVMIVFSLGMMIYVNVVKSSVSMQQMTLTLELKQISTQTLKDKSFFDDEIPFGNNTIIKRVSKYNDIENLYLIELEAQNPEEKVLAKRRELLYLQEE